VQLFHRPLRHLCRPVSMASAQHQACLVVVGFPQTNTLVW
jgi:hypothetical protein